MVDEGVKWVDINIDREDNIAIGYHYIPWSVLVVIVTCHWKLFDKRALKFRIEKKELYKRLLTMSNNSFYHYEVHAFFYYSIFLWLYEYFSDFWYIFLIIYLFKLKLALASFGQNALSLPLAF